MFDTTNMVASFWEVKPKAAVPSSFSTTYWVALFGIHIRQNALAIAYLNVNYAICITCKSNANIFWYRSTQRRVIQSQMLI